MGRIDGQLQAREDVSQRRRDDELREDLALGYAEGARQVDLVVASGSRCFQVNGKLSFTTHMPGIRLARTIIGTQQMRRLLWRERNLVVQRTGKR